jgi:hypothetical protein
MKRERPILSGVIFESVPEGIVNRSRRRYPTLEDGAHILASSSDEQRKPIPFVNSRDCVVRRLIELCKAPALLRLSDVDEVMRDSG